MPGQKTNTNTPFYVTFSTTQITYNTPKKKHQTRIEPTVVTQECQLTRAQGHRNYIYKMRNFKKG